MQATHHRPAYAAPAAIRPEAANSLLYQFGFACFLGLLFVSFSRLAETLANQLGANLRIALLLLAGAFGSAVLLGRVLGRTVNKMGLLLLLLTFWFLACVPTSVHKGGSVRHLNSYWFSTLLMSLCVLYYAQGSRSIRKMLYAIVAGTLLVAFARAEDSVFSIGALGNANLYGQHLLYGIPFILLPVFRHGFLSLRGGLAVAGVALLIAKVISTGSRSSLIATVIVLGVLFLQMPFLKKIAILLVAVPLGLIGVAMIPEKAMLRYGTLFDDDPNRMMTLEELSALESTRARKHHFQQSIDLTIGNPLLGVGPGMFPVASAEDSAEKGERALWKETHNSYTQISSETGIPGLMLYLGILLFTATSAWTTIRLAHSSVPGSELFELRQIAMSLLVSLLAMSITGFFSSSAYLSYFPLLGCLAMSTLQAAQREVAAASPAAAAGPPAQRPRPAAGPVFRHA